MTDARRLSTLAIVLLVVLRVAIGWQVLYEGLWKYNTLGTAKPWTSEGYLKNAQGPFRDFFRSIVGDPDDLGWLDYSEVSRRWYAWRDRFAKHYNLTDEQRQQLNRALDGSAEEDSPVGDLPPVMQVNQTLERLPAAVAADQLNRNVRFDAQAKRLTANEPLLPREEAELLGLVDVDRVGGQFVRRSSETEAPDPEEVAFFRAVQSLAAKSRDLSFRHKLAGALRGNPDTAGVTAQVNERGSFDFLMGTTLGEDPEGSRDIVRYGTIQEYRDLLADYERAVKQARIDYQHEHATMLGRKVAIMRGQLISPIQELDQGLKLLAWNLLTPEQKQQRALPPDNARLARADFMVMSGLIVLGTLLIVGLFTRFAALAAAVMIFSFYLVVPPWPGVPQPPGPEHSFIVNKNLIESLALLCFVALPSGRWFGLDGLLCRLGSRICRFCSRSKSA